MLHKVRCLRLASATCPAACLATAYLSRDRAVPICARTGLSRFMSRCSSPAPEVIFTDNMARRWHGQDPTIAG